MKFKQFSNAALIVLFTMAIIGITVIACSKSSGNGYGNGGNNGGGDNNGSSVSIAGFAFSVSSLAVKQGTTVKWTNNDATTHTVTADDGSFDSDNIAPGGTFSHTFSSQGTFAYHCKIHSSMTAKVVVSY